IGKLRLRAEAAFMTRSRHCMPFGAELLADGGVRFRFWAPSATRVDLLFAQAEHPSEHRMLPLQDGWFELSAPIAASGTRYAFRVDGAGPVPDPASRFNPDGVHAASMVIDPQRFEWRDGAWRGRQWHEAVIYELHVGTFTPAGTFAARAKHLDPPL